MAGTLGSSEGLVVCDMPQQAQCEPWQRLAAGALAALEEKGPESAISEINNGLQRFKDLFARYDAVDQYPDDELVRRLQEMRENIRQRYEVGRTLDEQLNEAVQSENYELAAKLRDKVRSSQTAQTDMENATESDSMGGEG